MRISDWSSDVCSSDLPSLVDDSLAPPGQHVASLFCQHFDPAIPGGWEAHRDAAVATIFDTVEAAAPGFRQSVIGHLALAPEDRKSVVSGKSGFVRVDLGGRRILKKKKNTNRMSKNRVR